MVADNQPQKTVWNVFYHMYLDKSSHSALIDQCKKLIELSDTLEHWSASPYGPYLKMCTEHTLVEVRRHWSLYVAMHDLSRQKLKPIEEAFTKYLKSTSSKTKSVISTARSAGPLMIDAIGPVSEHFRQYWKTGTTFFDPKQVTSCTILNPTFVYSRGREDCCVQYGLDPLISFHLSAIFGNAKGSITVSDVSRAAKAEFDNWCSAFRISISSTISPPTIRFFAGDANAVCRSLQAFATTGVLSCGVPVSQWKTQMIQLNSDMYHASGDGPASFNVIDTSNLEDHIGLLNCLISAVPLLSRPSKTGVIYTESLLFLGKDATKEFAERLYADIASVGLLVNLCPVDYLSGFTTRSNTHEVMAYSFMKGETTQYHQVTTWKSPTYGDALAFRGRPFPAFDPQQLGTFIWDMYHQMFEKEDSMTFWRLNENNMKKAISTSNLIHYTRESFALFLKLARDTINISDGDWRAAMDRVFELQTADKSMPMDTVNNHDWCTQLHRHGIYVAPFYRISPSRIGPFAHWDTIPTVVRVIMSIPREEITPIVGLLDGSGTPLLHCGIRGNWSLNIFSSVHIAFGKAVRMGPRSRPWVSFEEDPLGWKGSSPMVVSFTVAAVVLTEIEHPDSMKVVLTIRSTTGTVILTKQLGMDLTIFGAKLMDESLVHVVAEPSLPIKRSQPKPPPPSDKPYTPFTEIGSTSGVSVELDEQCELVVSLTSKITIENTDVRRSFGSEGEPAQVTQTSPCVMRVNVGTHKQDVVFPFPVIGSQSKLRLARKSLYIEVVVPISGPFKLDGMKRNPFPVIGNDGILVSSTVHRVNLDILQPIDIKAKRVGQWLNTHVGSMMSARERSMRKKNKPDPLMFLKDSLHTIFVRASGVQGGAARRVFSLADKATNNCDTVFFINELRFDFSSHTIVCDAYVLPLTHELMMRIDKPLAKVVTQGDMVTVAAFEGEMVGWKHLLPALVERCRSWKHGPNCEYKTQGKIPLVEVMEMDPLCSCGRGKDTEGMAKVALWKSLAPYVTRVALSPLFAVSFLETIGRDPSAHKCYVCRGRGKPKMMVCTGCQKVRYCSRECQKKDWKSHKLRCKP